MELQKSRPIDDEEDDEDKIPEHNKAHFGAAGQYDEVFFLLCFIV